MKSTFNPVRRNGGVEERSGWGEEAEGTVVMGGEEEEWRNKRVLSGWRDADRGS